MHVTLVHDYLNQYGGAERVLEVLHSMFPTAPVYTSFYEPDALPPTFMHWDIRTSRLARIPGAGMTHRLWTPLYPQVFRHLGRKIAGETDVIIADSSAWSHHAAPTHPDIPLLTYCHSPARFLYGDDEYLEAVDLGLLRPLAEGLFAMLRVEDQKAARRVTQFVANSDAVRDRIRTAYDRDALVVYPPIDTARFHPHAPIPPEDWYLVVSRLVPHKWIDRAVRAGTTADIPIKIIGSGRAEAELRAMAGPTIEFLGEQSDASVVEHMQRCRALILPGIEDFGMTAVEAQAAGRPVIAARGGGALESVIAGETGWFFSPNDNSELVNLLLRNEDWDSERIQAHARKFDRSIFEQRMGEIVDRVVSEH